MYKTELIVGDWSHDGHGKTQNEIIRTNYPSLELGIAFMTSATKLGVISHDYQGNTKPKFNFCAEYEEDTLPQVIVNRLSAGGIDIKNTLGEPEEHGWGIDTEMYINLWLEVAKLELPDLVWETGKVEYINIGGYGLFY